MPIIHRYRNKGDGTFAEVGLESGIAVNEDGSEQASTRIALGDYNHTGRTSIYLTELTDEPNTLYLK